MDTLCACWQDEYQLEAPDETKGKPQNQIRENIEDR